MCGKNIFPLPCKWHHIVYMCNSWLIIAITCSLGIQYLIPFNLKIHTHKKNLCAITNVILTLLSHARRLTGNPIFFLSVQYFNPIYLIGLNVYLFYK